MQCRCVSGQTSFSVDFSVRIGICNYSALKELGLSELHQRLKVIRKTKCRSKRSFLLAGAVFVQTPLLQKRRLSHPCP